MSFLFSFRKNPVANIAALLTLVEEMEGQYKIELGNVDTARCLIPKIQEDIEAIRRRIAEYPKVVESAEAELPTLEFFWEKLVDDFNNINDYFNRCIRLSGELSADNLADLEYWTRLYKKSMDFLKSRKANATDIINTRVDKMQELSNILLQSQLAKSDAERERDRLERIAMDTHASLLVVIEQIRAVRATMS